ncbi:MAG: glycosyltransferase [bacterium]
MSTILAPICLFTYNRLNETKQSVEALQNNYLALESDLFIFSDGAKDAAEAEKVNRVKQYLKTITGFKSITIYKSPKNKGLASSIISGVTQVIEQYGKVIVLEDDLITSPNFLDFMNQALDFYADNQYIHSISGYTLDLSSLKKHDKDYYLGYRASSWGWGTWKENWENVDWEVKNYDNFRKNPFKQIEFMRGGSDMPRMLKSQMKGRVDSWAIRWCFDQFQKKQFAVFPSKSKVMNIGMGENATHTKKAERLKTRLDDGGKRYFNFDKTPRINKKITKDFRKKFSFWARFKSKYLE